MKSETHGVGGRAGPAVVQEVRNSGNKLVVVIGDAAASETSAIVGTCKIEIWVKRRGNGHVSRLKHTLAAVRRTATPTGCLGGRGSLR